MTHTFKISINSSDIESEIAKVKSGILQSGGSFNGNTASGSFSGSGVTGTYFIIDKIATITITKKPFLITNKFVESKIRSYFS